MIEFSVSPYVLGGASGIVLGIAYLVGYLVGMKRGARIATEIGKQKMDELMTMVGR